MLPTLALAALGVVALVFYAGADPTDMVLGKRLERVELHSMSSMAFSILLFVRSSVSNANNNRLFILFLKRQSCN